MEKPGPIGAQGHPGVDGADNFTAMFYNTTNVTSYSNSTVFNNATNVTSNSNYTVVNGATFYNMTAINESYAYLPGRSGGQVWTCGVDANDDCIINGTSSLLKFTSSVILQPDGGNVTIGTKNSTPSKLEIASNYKTRANISSLNTNTGLYLSSKVDTSSTAGIITFYNIYNNLYTSVASIAATTRSTTDSAMLVFSTRPAGGAVTSRMRIFSDGNVTIGSSTLNSAQFNVAGDVRFANYGAGTATFDSGGNITSVSDEKYKIDIKTFTSSLNEISKVIPICYKFNPASGLDTQNTYCGFSAQQLKTSIPSAVFEKDDVRYEQVLEKKGVAGEEDEYETVEVKTGTTTLSISDRAIIATLVNAVKELSAKNDALEKRIAALEKKVGP